MALSSGRGLVYPWWCKKLAHLFITFKENRADSNGRVHVCGAYAYLHFPGRLTAAFFWHNRMKARAEVMQFESARLTLRIAARIRGILWRSARLASCFYLLSLEGNKKKTREKWKLLNEFARPNSSRFLYLIKGETHFFRRDFRMQRNSVWGVLQSTNIQKRE